MSEPALIVEDEGPVRILCLNRPGKSNAIDTALAHMLRKALADADVDDSVRALVLCGAGRSFCGGADLDEFKSGLPHVQTAALRRADLIVRTQHMMQRMRKPIVSAVRGAAVGGGAGLALACDMMVAGADVRLGYPEVPHSIVPALVMASLQQNVGRKLAFELISTGRMLSAAEITALGLANRVTDPDNVRPVASEIARGWATAAPHVISATKDLFYRLYDLRSDEAMRVGSDVNALMYRYRE